MNSTASMVVLLMSLLGWPAAADEAPARRAGEQARRLAADLVSLDAGGVIALTHPRVYELTGDPTQARARVRAVFESLKGHGLAHELGIPKTERMDIAAPSRTFRDGALLAAFVPYQAIEHSNKGGSVVRSFLLALSEDRGRNWRFVDGGRLDRQSIKAFLPGYAGVPAMPTTTRASGP